MINSMIVEMKNSGKAEAIAFFQALCSFWRSLYYFLQDPAIKQAAVKEIKDFISNKKMRLKGPTADVGVIYGLWMGLQDTIDGSEFLDAYFDECMIRQVMYYIKDSWMMPDAKSFFNSTQVSRDLLHFQTLFN